MKEALVSAADPRDAAPSDKIYALCFLVVTIDMLHAAIVGLVALELLPRNLLTDALVKATYLGSWGILVGLAAVLFLYWIVKGPLLLWFAIMMKRAPPSRQAKWQRRARNILIANVLLASLTIMGLFVDVEGLSSRVRLAILIVILATLPSAWALWYLHGREGEPAHADGGA